MREIRPYGSEGGGGETLPTPIITRCSFKDYESPLGSAPDLRLKLQISE